MDLTLHTPHKCDVPSYLDLRKSNYITIAILKRELMVREMVQDKTWMKQSLVQVPATNSYPSTAK